MENILNQIHCESEKWVLEAMYTSPTFPLSTTVPVGLTHVRFDDNNTKEKKLFNTAKEKELTVELSFSKAQKNVY